MGVSGQTSAATTTTITQRKKVNLQHHNQASHPPPPPDYSSLPSVDDDVVIAKPRKRLTNSRSIVKRRLAQTLVRVEESDPLTPRSDGGIKIAKKRLSKSASFIKPVRVGVRISRFTKCASNDVDITKCFSEATCSSKFRSTAFPDGDEPTTSAVSSSSSSSSKNVCSYAYCSLHGAGRPQLKRFASIKRPAPSGKTYSSKSKVQSQNKASRLSRDGENVLSKSDTAGPVTSNNIHPKGKTTQENPMCQNHQLSEATKDEKPREENEKTTRVWRLIYHSMLSAKYRSELYPQVSADSIPAAVQENSSQVISEGMPAVMPTFERSQMDAVKLVEDTIDELFLPELEQQLLNNQTGEATNKDAHESKLNDISGIVNHCTIDSVKPKQVKPFFKMGSESMSNNWSKLKQVMLLKRFVKALDKLSDLKFKEPEFLNVEADPEMEKVRLRRQTTEEKRLADEWMLDHALRQAVAKLTPARRKKVELLIEAFESVIPLKENETPHTLNESLSSLTTSSGHLSTEETEQSSVPFKEINHEVTLDTEHAAQKPSLVSAKGILNLGGRPGSLMSQDHPPLPTVRSPKHKLTEVASDVVDKIVSNTQTFHKHSLPNKSSTVTGLIGHYDNGITEQAETRSIPSLVRSVDSRHGNNEAAKMTKSASEINKSNIQEDPLRISSAKQRDTDVQLDSQKYFKMWGMIYNQVVSGTAAKIGSDLHITESVDSREAMDSKLDVVKLVEDALDEMLLPEYQDNSSDEQSVISDQDHQERMDSENMDSESSTPKDSVSFYFKEVHQIKVKTSAEADGEVCAATDTQGPKLADKWACKTNRLKSNGWSNLKKFILLKRFIRALDKLKKFNPREPNYISVEPDQEPEKVNLKHQTSADRLSAEQWMIDNAIQQVVARLTPARKRRVELLVEAFETVETVLPSPSTRFPLKHSWPSAPRTKHF